MSLSFISLSDLDFGSVACMSPADTNIKKVDTGVEMHEPPYPPESICNARQQIKIYPATKEKVGSVRLYEVLVAIRSGMWLQINRFE